MTTQDEGDLFTVVYPISPEEKFWLDIHDENIKQIIPRLNESINRLLVLSTGLAGGSFYIFKDNPADQVLKFLAITCFVLALISSGWAVIPFGRKTFANPTVVMDSIGTASKWKSIYLTVTLSLIVLGLFLAMIAIGIGN